MECECGRTASYETEAGPMCTTCFEDAAWLTGERIAADETDIGKDIEFDADRYSNRRERVLAFWRAFHLEYGSPPAIRDVMEALDIPSTSTVTHHRDKLIDDGLLVRKVVSGSDGRAPRAVVVPADWRKRACAAARGAI